MSRLRVYGLNDIYIGHPDKTRELEIFRASLDVLPSIKPGFVRIEVLNNIYEVDAHELKSLVDKNCVAETKVPVHGEE